MQYPHPLSLEVIEEIIDSCPELPVILSGPLGDTPCGDYGCVFLDNQDNVVKFTKQKKEIDAAKFIVSHQDQGTCHSGVPIIYDIWSWDTCHQYELPLYIIYREPICDLDVDPSWFDLILSKMEYDLYGKVESRTISGDDVFDKLSDLFDTNPGNPHDESVVEKIGEIYAWMIDNNRWIDDIQYNNWGQRENGTPVIRDLGAILEF